MDNLILYFIIGCVFSIKPIKYFAYILANQVGGSMSGHPVSNFKDMGEKPKIWEYIGCLLWAPPFLSIWPLTFIYYLYARHQFKLSNEEQILIDKHLKFYEDIDNYIRPTITEDQKRFYRVCRGLEYPKNIHEKAYIKYRRLINS